MAVKKTFLDANPALQFISAAQPEPQEPIRTPAAEFTLDEPAEIPAKKEPEQNEAPAYRLVRSYSETKSRRVQLLLRPSLFRRLYAMAEAERTSVNDLVHSLLDDAVESMNA
jgi:hypothetical protein